ncbi:MAG TPA: hypothetical protein VH206_19500 [Xanthobacteraceae bacterium]|nr:hypothetical protein [Xanthobacteraceae bacterium]
MKQLSDWPSLSARKDDWLADSITMRVKERIEMAMIRARVNADLRAYYFKNLTKSPTNVEKTSFIVLGLMRSGTTLLGDLLARHSELAWLGERFVKESYWPTLYLNGVTRAYPERCVGLKVFTFQLCNRNSFEGFNRPDIRRGRRILRRLRAQNWKFVHVVRRDIFAQALSLTRATRSGEWHQTSMKIAGNAEFRLNSRDFKLNLEFLIKCRSYEQDVLSALEILQLDYEADLFNPYNHQVTADKVFAHLGMRSVPVSSKMIRMAGDRLDGQIENYDDLVDAAESLGVHPT